MGKLILTAQIRTKTDRGKKTMTYLASLMSKILEWGDRQRPEGKQHIEKESFMAVSLQEISVHDSLCCPNRARYIITSYINIKVIYEA